MNGEINGVFIYNGQPQNGATAKLWKITGFASYADSTDEVENDPLAATDIELDVNNGGLFAVGDVIKIESELLRITKISTNKLYVIRGYRGTAPAEHVQNTQIDDETITEPSQDTAEPSAGYQQGSDITTAVAYGGDGAYRWTGVPEGEYYVSVSYDGHTAWLYAPVEINDPTPEQILRASGDVMIRNADGVTRLPKDDDGKFLKLVAGLPAWATEVAFARYCPLEVIDFQATPATGTFANPENTNDNGTGTIAQANNLDSYAEIDLGGLFKITQYRIFGHTDHNGTGRWKLQYFDEFNAWQDWITEIPTRVTADWSNWTNDGEQIGHKIKIIATTLDTGTGQSKLPELEVKF